MAKIINITDKLKNEKSGVQIGEKIYPINNSMNVVMKFEELVVKQTKESLLEAMTLTIGAEAIEELGVMDKTLEDFQVINIAIFAAMQNIDYEVAEARFLKR